MKKKITYLFFLLCLLNLGFIPKLFSQGASPLPYSQNFETSNDFTLNNGTQPNKWFYGTATGNPGKSLYISNDNGVTNGYNISSTSVTQVYKDITIPAGITSAMPATLAFDWKLQGESCCDYLRVWLVPATFTPTAGTQITALANQRIQIGGNFNQQSSWQNYMNTNINLAPFAGTTMRLVFEWRNDSSVGTIPSAAIDNINLLLPTCFQPTNLAVGTITTTNATFSWNALTPAPGLGYEYYISTSPTAPGTTVPPGGITGTTTSNSVTITTLSPNTTYYWWVRSVCSTTDSSLWSSFGTSFSTTQIPASLPYAQTFNTNDFGFSNGTQANKWAYGSAIGNPANSIYISNNNGVTNEYTISSTSVVHAYRDITVPAGTTAASPALLSFDWLGMGESSFDYLRVWLVPGGFNPTPGTQISALANQRIQIGGNLNLQAGWQNYLNTAVNLAPYAGSTVRLVFEWRNDSSGGTQPPAAVDNINFLIPTCKVPTGLTTSAITANSATISWTAPSPAPANGYQYYYSTSPIPPTSATGSTTSTSLTLNGLTPNTTYYWWVRSVCSTTDSSIWIAGPSFTTTQIPATIPYVQPFNSNDFGFTNGSQTNKWVFGSATGNTGNSLYISNDNGVTNAYTISATTVVHAYRDIAVPAGASVAKLSFDWKGVGESSFDYMRVWLVPASFMPTAGTQITALANQRIQVGTNLNQQSTWQTYNNANLNISAFAGQTMRLVFEWRNDSSGGTQPPGAIDNVNLFVCNNATPTLNVSAVTYNSATLTWNQDLNGASYTIRYRVVGSTGGWNTITVPALPYPQTTNTTTLTGLNPASKYEVEIAAVCNNTPGAYAHKEFNTPCDPTPPNIVISNLTSTSATVTWNPLAVSANYILRWRVTGGTWNTLTIAQTPQPPLNTYQLTGLTPYTTYEVQVANQCVGSSTPNTWSTPQVFTTIRTCPIAPPGLTITNLTTTTAEVTWDPFPGATYIFSYRKVGIPNWTNIPVSINNFTLTGLQEQTRYEMKVANVCNGTTGNYTPLYYFTTPTITYCSMHSTTGNSEYISGVIVTPTGKPQMTNNSTGSTYTDYTNVPSTYINMIQGTNNNSITVKKNITSGTKAGVVAWIDFNRNGYFDINEKILSDGPNANATATATFSVPNDAFISMSDYKYVVMRVALQKDGIPVNCTNFNDGEVEDYMVKISKQDVSTSNTDITIYPNPVSTVLNVKNISAKANYKIYSAAGQLVASGIILNNKIDVSRLIIGVYVIDIEDSKGNVQKKFIKE